MLPTSHLAPRLQIAAVTGLWEGGEISEVEIKAKHESPPAAPGTAIPNGGGCGDLPCRGPWRVNRDRPYPSRAVRGAASGKQQPDDVQVVVMDGHVQGSQAILQGQDHRDNSVRSAGFPRSLRLSAAPFRALYIFFYTSYDLVRSVSKPSLDLKSLKSIPCQTWGPPPCSACHSPVPPRGPPIQKTDTRGTSSGVYALPWPRS